MRVLQGLFPATEISSINEATRTIFGDDTYTFTVPESVIIYEQHMLPEDRLLELCQLEYNDDSIVLSTPKIEYIPREILDEFRNKNCVPISYDLSQNLIYVGVLPECSNNTYSTSLDVQEVYVPMYYYVKLHTKYYGSPSFVKPLAVIDYLRFIFNEATKLKALDITIANVNGNTKILGEAMVFYNVKKQRIDSLKSLPAEMVGEIATMLASQSGATFDSKDRSAQYFDIDIDPNNRGRVVVNKTFDGWSITIRVLPTAYLDVTLEELNIETKVCSFIRDVFFSKEKGLRLLIGETASGKNTTILSGLNEIAQRGEDKIVIIGNPIETPIPNSVQISVDNESEFANQTDSLLRQNPDMVYITEITERSALATIKQANTSKAVFSTVHANSNSDVISRLNDITGLSPDRIVLALQSTIYQQLIRDEETGNIYPINKCIHYTQELKDKLYGHSLAEMTRILREEELKLDVNLG